MAIADFDSAIGKFGWPRRTAHSYNERGLTRVSMGEHELAASDFGEAIRLDHREAEYVNNRGLAYLAMGEHDLSIADFDYIISEYPDDHLLQDVYENRRSANEARGDFESAAADYIAERRLWDDAYEAEASDKETQAQIHGDMAEYYRQLEQFDLAIAEYTTAIEIDPSDPACFNNRGLAYLDVGEYDLAIGDFETAIGMSPWGSFGWATSCENRDKALAAQAFVAKVEEELAFPDFQVQGDSMEPYQLRRWTMNTASGTQRYFYTCGRPGRSLGRDCEVPDVTVSEWVNRLPGPDTAIVSLLGRKGDWNGLSEYSYYSFCGPLDKPEERGNKPSFQEWLDHHHEDLRILACEHPTLDYRDIPSDKVAAIASDVNRLIEEGRTVVVIDSGGISRTGQVAAYLRAIEG